MALDNPDVVKALAVLDVIPVATAWDLADDRLALGFWPWSLLAQSEPLPEQLLLGAPDAVIRDAMSQWGSSPECFPEPVFAAYSGMLSDADHVHAFCEEYRAAAGIDRDHDVEDRKSGHRIACRTLVLWSGEGPLGSWYESRWAIGYLATMGCECGRVPHRRRPLLPQGASQRDRKRTFEFLRRSRFINFVAPLATSADPATMPSKTNSAITELYGGIME